MNNSIKTAENTVETDIAHGVPFLSDYEKDLTNLQTTLNRAGDKKGLSINEEYNFDSYIQNLLDDVDDYKKSCKDYNSLTNNVAKELSA